MRRRRDVTFVTTPILHLVTKVPGALHTAPSAVPPAPPALGSASG